MIKFDKGNTEIVGDAPTVLADYAMITRVLLKVFPREDLLKNRLYGLYAENAESIERIDELLKSVGLVKEKGGGNESDAV